jgi:hypothetical protein
VALGSCSLRRLLCPQIAIYWTLLCWANRIPTRDEGGMSMKEYEGQSANGSFQDALQDAIAKAIADNIPDAEVTWSLSQVTGRAGTILGVREITVRIQSPRAAYKS